MKNTKNHESITQSVARIQEDYYEYMETVHGAFSNPWNKPVAHNKTTEAVASDTQPLSSFVAATSHKAAKPALHRKRHAHAVARIR